MIAAHDAGRRSAGDIAKAAIYTLLVINLGVYIWQDWDTARRTLDAGAPLLKWTDAFATSLDDLAWIILLLLYELQTAWLTGVDVRRSVKWIMQGARIVCYGAIIRTLFVYIDDLGRAYAAAPIEGLRSLCRLARDGQHFYFNQEYTGIAAENCGMLGRGAEFFRLDAYTVTDVAGLTTEFLQAWLSVAESILWLIVVLLIELMLQIQARGVSGGPLIRGGNAVNLCSYCLIIAIACYWGWMGHLLYLWDDMIWIGGFALIALNLSQWRRELQHAQAAS